MNHGVCPVCSGSGRRPVPEDSRRYVNVLAGYDAATDTLECNNCGGQYMFSRPTGKVNIDFGGQPCKHEYTSTKAGRCLTEYNCKFCGDRYQIDSGD